MTKWRSFCFIRTGPNPPNPNSWEPLGFLRKIFGLQTILGPGFCSFKSNWKLDMKLSHDMYFSQRIPRPTSYKLPNQIIHFYPHPKKEVETCKTFKLFFFWNKISAKALVPCFQLAPSPKTPPPHKQLVWPEGPESLDIMRKSKAKPIIPPAAHQCPRKAAMVGNGKQHILEAILEKLQPAGVASWHVVGETCLNHETKALHER